MNPLLAEGFARSKAVTREHAKSFYFASAALFGARRRGAFALYAFCRRLDDLVDEGDAQGLPERLLRARETVASLYVPTPELACSNAAGRRGVASPGPWHPTELLALEDTVRRFRIPEQPLQDLISGMEMDLTLSRYLTFEQLDLYCYRVAGTVGLMLTPLLGYSDERALAPAADLGRAMQLTNILRDVGEDLDRGRIYLPLEELAAFGLGEEDLRAKRVDARWVRFLQWQMARARAYYARAAAGVPFLEGFGSQRMVRLMGAIYSGILGAIESNGYDVFRRRAQVPLRRKLWVAARVVALPRTVLPALDLPLPPLHAARSGG